MQSRYVDEGKTWGTKHGKTWENSNEEFFCILLIVTESVGFGEKDVQFSFDYTSSDGGTYNLQRSSKGLILVLEMSCCSPPTENAMILLAAFISLQLGSSRSQKGAEGKQ